MSGQATPQRVARELPLDSESCQRVDSLARHTPAPSNKGLSVCLSLAPACLDGLWEVVALLLWGRRDVAWRSASLSGGGGSGVCLEVAELLWERTWWLPGGRLASLGGCLWFVWWLSCFSGGSRSSGWGRVVCGLVAVWWLSGLSGRWSDGCFGVVWLLWPGGRLASLGGLPGLFPSPR